MIKLAWALLGVAGFANVGGLAECWWQLTIYTAHSRDSLPDDCCG